MNPHSVLVTALLAAILSPCGSRAQEAASSRLIGHWPLQKDCRDTSGSGRDGQPQHVTFGDSAAQFNGRDSRVEIPDQPGLKLGTTDFTVALWVHTPAELDDDLGDLVCKFDPDRRRGFTLSLRNNCVTSSQSNYRQLQFGIDNGTEPRLHDLGRPGNAVLGFALCVHDGRLYCGTCEPGANESGHVYRYQGDRNWTDLGLPDKSNTVVTMAAYRGKLYVGTGKYRLGGSALAESENPHLGGRVFRLEDDGRWTLAGQLPEVESLASLVVYKGRLYASSLYRPASFFRYEEDGKWTSLGTPNGKRVESLAVYNGYLWASGYDEGQIYRFDGREWRDWGQVGDNSQTYSFAVERGQLYVGTWRSGRVFRLDARDRWADTGRLGEELEVMGMLLHNGKLYAGSLPLAEMFRHDGDDAWHSVGRLDLTPGEKYRRIWTCAQYQGRLVATTLPSGHVQALEAGCCVTHDHELPPGWQHVTAVRRGDRLQLYVNGRRVAESAKFQPDGFDLSNAQPLVIGRGPCDSLHGGLCDVRLYGRALTDEEIASLARARP